MPRGSSLRIAAVLVAAAGAVWYARQDAAPGTGVIDAAAAQPASIRPAIADPVQAAFRNRSSGQVLTAKGTVERILADDRDGSPHQRFIIRTVGGVSLLIAHNLDLAPRLDGLKVGDAVTVLGEYEWNDKGGLMHWTHEDPQRKHAAGYIDWRGRRYQ